MLNKIISIICAIILAWLAFSWADIVVDNTDPNPTHWKYNAIVLLTDWAEAHPPA